MEGRAVYLLTALLILTTFTTSTHSASCCLRYIKKKLSCQLVLDYSLQSMGKFCDMNAVIFHLPGRFLCANPNLSWTQRVRRCIDERKSKSESALIQQSNSTAAA
ncbi:C-C motif chemokine 20b [Hippocampus comes]|uniref:C-C motif chemokine 20b n=1 Tax=Hippocampus comes TaxID=109280 RepID=UPI00094E4C51|nr:PREDICTED: C-C motif chemokine 20-like [Hippocampus comes]